MKSSQVFFITKQKYPVLVSSKSS